MVGTALIEALARSNPVVLLLRKPLLGRFPKRGVVIFRWCACGSINAGRRCFTGKVKFLSHQIKQAERSVFYRPSSYVYKLRFAGCYNFCIKLWLPHEKSTG